MAGGRPPGGTTRPASRTPARPAAPARGGAASSTRAAAPSPRATARPARPERAPARPPAPRAEAPPTVSPTSAERFAARVRARHRRTWLIAGGAVAAVLLLGWAALFAPWATVRRIEVTGTARVDPVAVRDAAAAELGRPMLLAAPGRVEAAVRTAQPLVASVTVLRDWPSGLRVSVVERQPVAAIRSGAGVRLVDRDGVTVATAAMAPKDLPVLDVKVTTPNGVAALRACLAVIRELPRPVASRVRSIGANGPDGVRMTLRGGAVVQWGSAEQTPLKAEVLQVLLKQKAQEYDLRSPVNPAVRRD